MRKHIFFSLIILLLFTSCTTLRQQELDSASYLPEAFEWQEVCPGVARFDFKNTDVPLIYHAVKIDLDMSDEQGSLCLVCGRGVKTSEFAAQEQLDVAVNATPFDKAGELVGIHKESGEVVSKSVSRYAAIAFNKKNARIFAHQNLEELSDFSYAFGGFFTVMEDGVVRQDFIDRKDSRSGAGLSADGKTLYLLVVEGENQLQSCGLSYPQCGEIFLAMGCSNALEFDGGGSAELCINGKSVLSYKVKRVHGNCFGFKLR